MKTPLLVLSLLLFLLVLPPAGHGAHHRHRAPMGCRLARLRPLRVMRPPAVAQQHRLVRAVW